MTSPDTTTSSTQIASVLEQDNPFLIAHQVVLGSYVRDPFGRRGRVYQVHYGCPESQEWMAAQVLDVQDASRSRWVSILCDGGGAVSFPADRVELIEPFELRNNSALFYFGEGKRG